MIPLKKNIISEMDIIMENLRKTYGNQTVIDIPRLTLRSGQLVGLVGNNGAGKTTLMRLILDLIKADGGRVLSGGMLVSGDDTWKTYTGSYIDKRFLIDFYTPDEFFDFIGEVYAIDPDALKHRLEAFAPLMRNEILGTGKYIRDFSEGNRQKIGIIGAMLIRPKVLILDEPFNYLDPSSQIVTARLIRQMNKELGATVLISSHNLNFISEISDRVLLMEKGSIVKDLLCISGSAEQELQAYFAAL